MSKLAKALTAAAGNAGESLYVEDVFSTYLYTGNGSTQTITNGIDLAGEGGLVWSKKRSGAESHVLFDTEAQKRLETNSTNSGGSGYIPTYFNFLGDGYFMDWSAGGMPNDSGDTYASWTFRKAEKFFDVVTYTGDGDPNRTVAHNLGSVPACIIVKRLNSTGDWAVYHQGTSANPEQNYLWLNSTDSVRSSIAYWNDTAPTDTEFSVRTNFQVNSSGSTYVAYLFASDAGGFGDDGSESIIKCGSYTGNGSTDGPEIDCGFEPQWLLVKRTDSGDGWPIVDSMRGFTADGSVSILRTNNSNAEGTDTGKAGPTSTGFKLHGTSNEWNASGGTYIYIAIRRPMKTPDSGAEVFAADFRFSAEAQAVNPASQYYSGFPVDLHLNLRRTGGGVYAYSRIQGGSNFLRTSDTSAEVSSSTSQFDSNVALYPTGSTNSEDTDQVGLMFKRATGFFDVVAYAGTDDNPQVVSHNLGVAPEMMLIKNRKDSSHWACYHSGFGATRYMFFETSNALETRSGTSIWDDTAPTDTQFTVSKWQTDGGNVSGYDAVYKDFIAYLFASLDGVSKVGSYTGTGADLNVDCGFSAGARFILIKRTDSTGDWYVWDSVRGIVAGNDPYLLLNSTAAEVTSTDYIDPLASGFTVTSSAPAALNASGGTYIFLAIA